jgi:hypothetical protein
METKMEDVIFFKNQAAFNHWLEEHTHVTELCVGYYKKVQGVKDLLGVSQWMLRFVLVG